MFSCSGQRPTNPPCRWLDIHAISLSQSPSLPSPLAPFPSPKEKIGLEEEEEEESRKSNRYIRARRVRANGWEGGRGLEIEPKGGEGPLPPPSLLSTEVVAFLSFPSESVPLRWVSGCPALAPEEESSSGGDLLGGKDKRGRKLRPVLLLSCGWVDFRQQWKRRKGGSQIAAARKEKGPPPPSSSLHYTLTGFARGREEGGRAIAASLFCSTSSAGGGGGILYTEQQSRAEGPLNVLPCVAGPGGA